MPELKNVVIVYDAATGKFFVTQDQPINILIAKTTTPPESKDRSYKAYVGSLWVEVVGNDDILTGTRVLGEPDTAVSQIKIRNTATREDWRSQVAQGKTELSYKDWMQFHLNNEMRRIITR